MYECAGIITFQCNPPLAVRVAAKKSGKFDDCPEKLEWKLRVVSENNFPTAAGLASSAAGYSCLVYTLATLYGLQDEIELSALARMGSGSACRSIYGGFVQWQRGEADDGHDSTAVQLAPATHWPDLELLILVVNDAHKKTSSTSGMSRSVATSPLLQHRAAVVVPQRIAEMRQAIAEKNFDTFAQLSMRDSNQFHAVCLDTFPPCVYLTDVSHAVINAVHSYNAAWTAVEGCEQTKAGYTFDAGPNACILILRENVPHFVSYLKQVFPSSSSDATFFTGIATEAADLPVEVANKLDLVPAGTDLLKYVIHTRIGDGPKRVSS